MFVRKNNKGEKMSKQCIKCYRTKPLSEFYLKKDGYYRGACTECFSQQVMAWARKNKDRMRDIHRTYFEKVSNGERPHRKEAAKIRAANNKVIKSIALCKRLGEEISVKEKTFLKHFGCSGKVFVQRFERYFEKNPGMGWHNYGAWHMDHIKPMKEFSLNTAANRKLCNYYTNLRPVWAKFNMKKSAKYAVEQTI